MCNGCEVFMYSGRVLRSILSALRRNACLVRVAPVHRAVSEYPTALLGKLTCATLALCSGGAWRSPACTSETGLSTDRACESWRPRKRFNFYFYYE